MNIILACDKKFGIGLNNKLPWNIKEDMNKFKTITIGNKNNAVIMGKNTYLSLNSPLSNRTNIVVSKTLFDNIKQNQNIDNSDNIIKHNGFIICNNFNTCLHYANVLQNLNEIWIIGGAQLYEYVIKNYNINKAYVTVIDENIECNVYLEKETVNFINNCKWSNVIKEKNEKYYFTFYEYINIS